MEVSDHFGPYRLGSGGLEASRRLTGTKSMGRNAAVRGRAQRHVRLDAGGSTRTSSGAVQRAEPACTNTEAVTTWQGMAQFIFPNFTDQQIYLKLGEGEPRVITSTSGMRYADYVHDPYRDRLVSVREITALPGPKPGTRSLASI